MAEAWIRLLGSPEISRIEGQQVQPPNSVTVRSYLEAARASRASGAVERAMDQLRAASALAERTGQPELRAESLLELARGMIHSVGARGPEVDTLLHKSLTFLAADDASPLTASAYLALGWLAALRGTPDSAIRWLGQAERSAGTGPWEQAGILAARGFIELDLARYEAAYDTLGSATELAVLTGDRRRQAFALTHRGRGYFLQGDLGRAADALDKALEVVTSEQWVAFAPFVEALRGEVCLAEGQLGEAADFIDHATVLANLSGDNAGIIVAATAQARLHMTRGGTGMAQQHIQQVLPLNPGWMWARGRLMDTACELSMSTWSLDAERHATRLTSLAGRSGMHELVVRAHSHRGVLGDKAAAKAVPVLVQGIQNPALKSHLVARRQLSIELAGD